MVAVFSDLDSAFGGGHSRAALAGYLAYDIAPRLHAGGHAAARRGFLSAATRLVYLCGFMCFDDERQDLAQNYYLLALRLAARNGDPAAYAITLRALSVQARTLGQRRPAVHLAETAAAARGIHPAQQAFLFGQVAVAAAADGDRTGALSALTTAERRLQRAGGAADAPMGGYHPAALAHQQAAVRALLGDRTGAITALGTSLRHRPAGERRSRAITTARLAELHLRQGHVEQAVVTWHAFLDDYPQLRSSRATRALATMRSSLRPHGRSPAVARLLRRAASTGSTVPPGR
jgi:tetratricopeptide (TPR) repeat protein